MSLLALIPGVYRWIALAILIAALAIGIPIAVHRHDTAQQAIGYDKRAAEDKAAADQQAQANRDLQRQAEKRYTVQAEVRDRFIVTTVREIRHDTENLAACVLSPSAVDRLRHAAECASEDRPASCGAGGPVPVAGHAP
jgi:hypothetical protein